MQSTVLHMRYLQHMVQLRYKKISKYPHLTSIVAIIRSTNESTHRSQLNLNLSAQPIHSKKIHPSTHNLVKKINFQVKLLMLEKSGVVHEANATQVMNEILEGHLIQSNEIFSKYQTLRRVSALANITKLFSTNFLKKSFTKNNSIIKELGFNLFLHDQLFCGSFAKRQTIQFPRILTAFYLGIGDRMKFENQPRDTQTQRHKPMIITIATRQCSANKKKRIKNKRKKRKKNLICLFKEMSESIKIFHKNTK